VQLGDDRLGLGAQRCGRVRKVEPLLERVEVVENVGEDEVEEGPKFGEVVLGPDKRKVRKGGLDEHTWSGVPVRMSRFALEYRFSSWMSLQFICIQGK
jgi:hypothetical protein